MSSPRKFAEKIALIQQKQAEGDAAFNTIIYEVEAAKQRADRVPSIKSKLDVPVPTYEIPNGINNSNSNNYFNQSIKIENSNGSNRLLLPPDNSSWRRTHSDSCLHQTVMPTPITHYHAQLDNENNNQQLNFDVNDIQYETIPYNIHDQSHHLQISNSQLQPHNYYDLNNNNYDNNGTNTFYPSIQTLSVPQQNLIPLSTHTALNSQYNSGNNNSNSLLLPPNQNSRGGSLPDLRVGSPYNNQQLSSTSSAQQFYRSPSPQENSNGDIYVLGPQQQSSSRIGPLKQSPSMRRRHSPIGDARQASPRRHNSPSPDVSSTQQTHHRIEPQSPQSQSSYSPQNSPHFLQSPGNDLTSYSPQQQSTDNQNVYFTITNHLDQITLDNNFYAQQQQQQQPPSPSSQQHNNSSPKTSNVTNDLQQQKNFFPQFLDDVSSSYCHNQPTMNMTTTTVTNQKSPTIPNIILTDVDSSKLDLSKELANDFSDSFDNLLDPTDLQLNDDDFLLNAADLSVDPINCDDTFCMER
ncbi:unnamed protein product [Rotaria sp. Silwood1]|nr:unnamed protein product [Rotaria sp. Silwood1]CAF0995157.1 unnamed protein product [Rotaria sp. Silwood1]